MRNVTRRADLSKSSFVLKGAIDPDHSIDNNSKRKMKIGERFQYYSLSPMSKTDFRGMLHQKGWSKNPHPDTVAEEAADIRKYHWSITKIRVNDGVFLSWSPIHEKPMLPETPLTGEPNLENSPAAQVPPVAAESRFTGQPNLENSPVIQVEPEIGFTGEVNHLGIPNPTNSFLDSFKQGFNMMDDSDSPW